MLPQKRQYRSNAQVTGKPKIFISYSSKDRCAAEIIHKNLEAAGFVVWRDQTRLETDWSREIAFALADSDLICLLWSEHSEKSKWVKNEWLTARALEKWIIPCLFTDSPDLPPPLQNLHGVSFASIRIGCNSLQTRLSEVESSLKQYDYTVLPRNSYIPFNPNREFKGRHVELLELYLKMIGNLNKIGVNQVGAVGMGGVGKTQLAVEFAHRFSYGFHAVFWVQAVNSDTWHNEFVSIARDRLKGAIKDFDKFQNDKQILLALQKYFKEHPNTLVVMDNITEPKQLNKQLSTDSEIIELTPLTLGCDLLFTTRRHFNLPGVASQEINILSPEAAYALLSTYKAPETSEDKNHALAICRAVGFLPLALILVGAYLKKYSSEISFAIYHDELVKKGLESIDKSAEISEMSEEDLATRHMAALKATLDDQWKMLKDEDARQLFRLAGQYPEATILPKAHLGLLSGIAPGDSKLDQPLAKAFHHLHDLCLMERVDSDASAIRLHPLIHDFANQLVPVTEQADFMAEATRRLKDALFNYTRLETEIERRGVHYIIGDLATAIYWLASDKKSLKELNILHSALKRSMYVLERDKSQLAGQLYGHLLIRGEQCMAIQSLLDSVWDCRKDRPWLRPLTQSLSSPGGPLLQTLEGHQEDVKSVVFSPDGKLAISGSRDKTIKVWDLQTGTEVSTLEGHSSCVKAVTISPDGNLVLSTSYDSTVKVWDLRIGKELKTFTGLTGGEGCIAISPDGELAISAYEEVVKVWRLKTGEELSPFTGHTDRVTCIAICPNGKFVMTGSLDLTVRVWDLHTREELAVLTGHSDSGKAIPTSPDWVIMESARDHKTSEFLCQQLGNDLMALMGRVTCLAISPDGKLALSACEETVKVWSLQTKKEVHTFTAHSDWVNSVTFSPDGKLAFSVSNDNRVKVWNLQTGEEFRVITGQQRDLEESTIVSLDKKVAFSVSADVTIKVWVLRDKDVFYDLKTLNCIAVSPDGQVALSATWDTTIKVWNLKTKKKLRTLTGHSAAVKSVAISPDAKLALSAGIDNKVKVWDLQSGKELKTFTGTDELNFSLNSVAISPDGKLALSASHNNTIKVWDLYAEEFIPDHSDRINVLAVSSDGKLVLSASSDKTVKVWDLFTGKKLKELKPKNFYGEPDIVHSIAITPDGNLALLALHDGSIKVWELWAWKELSPLDGHNVTVNSVAISPDGKLALAAFYDKTVKVWDLQSREQIMDFTGHTDNVKFATFCLDGKKGLSVSNDGTVKVWDLQTGEEICTFTKQFSPSYSVAVSLRGKLVLSASRDPVVWDLETGEERHLSGHSDLVNSVAISPDGKLGLSASQDNTAKVWDILNGKVIASFDFDSPAQCCVVATDGITFVVGDNLGRVHFLRLEGQCQDGDGVSQQFNSAL